MECFTKRSPKVTHVIKCLSYLSLTHKHNDVKANTKSYNIITLFMHDDTTENHVQVWEPSKY